MKSETWLRTYVALSFIIMLCFLPGNVQAKQVGKLKFSKDTVSLSAGQSRKVKVKGKYQKIKAKAGKSGIARASVKGKKITITGVSEGKTKVTVKAYKNGKLAAKGKITVKVTPGNTTSDQSGNPSEETASYDAGEYSIKKEHTGEATFYDRVSTGAANLDEYEKDYLTAALNHEDYMNGLAGAYLEVVDKDGDKVNVLITDRLPEGKKGDIDLSRKAFGTIEPEITGRMAVTWKIIPFPTKSPIFYLWKDTSSIYWAEIQVRNGRYPIKSLEYYDKTSDTYKALERKEYNYFAAPSGMGEGPYTFRVTDFYGHVLVDKDIAIRNDGKMIKGKSNFPY